LLVGICTAAIASGCGLVMEHAGAGLVPACYAFIMKETFATLPWHGYCPSPK
jgi:hypothetical protein